MIFDANGNVAQALGPGQGVIDTAQIAPGFAPGNPFDQWVDGFVLNQQANPLTTALGNLQNTIGQWSRTDAIAGSLLQRGLDRLAAVQPPTAVGATAMFPNLSRAEWWRLFVDLNQQNTPAGALVFDYQVSPGYYHAMINAFVDVLVANGPHADPGQGQTDAQWYDQLHQDVVAGVLNQVQGNWVLVGNTVSGTNGFTSFPMGHPPNPDALVELADEGVLGLIGMGGAPACRFDITTTRIRTAYLANTVPAQVNALFATYTAQAAHAAPAAAALMQLNTAYRTLATHADAAASEIGALAEAGNPELLAMAARAARKARAQTTTLPWAIWRQRVRHIARLIRALHVGHYYTDANGRLNTMLLLNRVLQRENLPPVVMADTSVFGGSQTLEQLAEQIVVGMLRFQSGMPRQ